MPGFSLFLDLGYKRAECYTRGAWVATLLGTLLKNWHIWCINFFHTIYRVYKSFSLKLNWIFDDSSHFVEIRSAHYSEIWEWEEVCHYFPWRHWLLLVSFSIIVFLNPLSARIFTDFGQGYIRLQGRVLHKEAWFATLLGTLGGPWGPDYKMVKISGLDNSSLAVKGLRVIQ